MVETVEPVPTTYLGGVSWIDALAHMYVGRG